ncbi:MAG: putative 7-carboxy-7-deazaguanine synthase QueE [Porcipelethomonas sp.]
MYKTAEKFVSINGEGTRAGQLAVFIRFTGCNLRCSYCDTMWANLPDTPSEENTAEDIYSYIKNSGVQNVTITGGEPLIQPGIKGLLEYLCKDTRLRIEIETNGSVDLEPFSKIPCPPSFTMDYKLPSSGMESFMNTENFRFLTCKDTVKFVAGSINDLETAHNVIRKYDLTKKCSVYLSPVFGKIRLSDIVEFMKENRLNDVNMQLQMHKFIWPPDMKGV